MIYTLILATTYLFSFTPPSLFQCFQTPICLEFWPILCPPPDVYVCLSPSLSLAQYIYTSPLQLVNANGTVVISSYSSSLHYLSPSCVAYNVSGFTFLPWVHAYARLRSGENPQRLTSKTNRCGCVMSGTRQGPSHIRHLTSNHFTMILILNRTFAKSQCAHTWWHYAQPEWCKGAISTLISKEASISCLRDSHKSPFAACRLSASTFYGLSNFEL